MPNNAECASNADAMMIKQRERPGVKRITPSLKLRPETKRRRVHIENKRNKTQTSA